MPKISKTCTVDDCQKAIGLCSMHWKRLKFHGDVNTVLQRGGHNKIGGLCTIEGCEKQFVARGFCQMHYRRWDLYGDPLHKEISGNKKPAKYRSVLAVGHPNANANGTIFEHRLVMSNAIGRALVEGETVHHMNGNTLDNRIENLELWSTKQPYGQRPEDKVVYALEILALYGKEYVVGVR